MTRRQNTPAITPEEACREVLADPDPQDCAEFLAGEGLMDSAALWMLYDEHRIMAPARAWVHAARHFDDLDPSLGID